MSRVIKLSTGWPGSEVPGGGCSYTVTAFLKIRRMVATTASEAARTILARSPWFRQVDPAIYYRRVFRFWNPAHRDRKTPLRMGRRSRPADQAGALPDPKDGARAGVRCRGFGSAKTNAWRIQRTSRMVCIPSTAPWRRVENRRPGNSMAMRVCTSITARRRSRIRVVDLVADTREQSSAFSACLTLLQSEGASEAQACSSLQSAQQIFETCGMASFKERARLDCRSEESFAKRVDRRIQLSHW